MGCFTTKVEKGHPQKLDRLEESLQKCIDYINRNSHIKNFKIDNIYCEVKKEGLFVIVDDVKLLGINHCGKPAEFVCLLRQKGDSIEYGQGKKYVSGLYHISQATSFIWKCNFCNTGFSTQPNND